MRRTGRALLCGIFIGLPIVPAASAQSLDEICPGAEDGTGALWGAVLDTDADVVLPGVTVFASWSVEGEERRSEARTGLDGVYRMCHLPLETSVRVYASFGTLDGTSVAVTLTEIFTRRDLGLSTSSTGPDGSDDRLWLCVEGGQSVLNMQFSRLVRCDEGWQPLENCPKEELGLITVQPVGAGSGMLREMVEQLVLEAKRLGANAVVNVKDARGGTSFGATLHATSVTAEGVRIEVDPSTCR